MNENRPQFPDRPFTLEGAKEHILWLEDIATIERDAGEAARHILLNLLDTLHRSKVIDAHVFLQRMLESAAGIEEMNVRNAVETLSTAALLELKMKDIRGQGNL